MDKKEFAELDRRIKTERPDMTNRQLIHVEGWGELSRQEQDRRFPGLWESGRFRELMDDYPGENPADDPE